MTNTTTLINRIKEFQKDVEPFCNIQLRYDMSQHNPIVLCATLRMNSEKPGDKVCLQEVVNKYKDIIPYVRIYESMPINQIERDIQLFQFNRMKDLIVQDLIDFIDHVKTQPQNEAIYCLHVWLDTGNCCIDFHVNNEKVFNQRLKSKQSGEMAKYYSSKTDILNYRFYEHTTLSGVASKALNNLLWLQCETISKNYARYGEPYLSQITRHYEKFFIYHVASAINMLKPKMKEMNITDDFITYIRFYDEDSITHFQALCETVPLETIKHLLGGLYLDFLA